MRRAATLTIGTICALLLITIEPLRHRMWFDPLTWRFRGYRGPKRP